MFGWTEKIQNDLMFFSQSKQHIAESTQYNFYLQAWFETEKIV